MAGIYKRSESDIYQAQFYLTSAATGELSKVRKTLLLRLISVLSLR